MGLKLSLKEQWLHFSIDMSYNSEHGIEDGDDTTRHRRRFANVEELWGFIQDRSAGAELSQAQQIASQIVSQLLAGSATDIRKPLPETYVDKLDRVKKTKLKSSDSCPICAERYLDDPYPLVVRLPCQGKHEFDLDCVRLWFKRNSTCPMCREDLTPKPKSVAVEHDDEEEFDNFYG